MCDVRSQLQRWRYYVSNYFYCLIQWEGLLLHDAERDRPVSDSFLSLNLEDGAKQNRSFHM